MTLWLTPIPTGVCIALVALLFAAGFENLGGCVMVCTPLVWVVMMVKSR